jgi:regulator of protease activity HflC (stomatin/prohibitin superfamily)
MHNRLRAGSTVIALALCACTMVDSTEHCVETRMGEVINPHMSTGLNISMITDATCFKLTDQNYPEDGEAEQVEAVTKSPNPVKVVGDVAIVYAFDPTTVPEVFNTKRSEANAELDIYNAMREGYRNALATWTVADVFSERRAEIGDSVKAAIQRKLGDRAIIKNVFIRNIQLPPEIEQARNDAAQQAQVIAKQRQQFEIDSMAARSKVMQAQAEAESKRLLAQSYSANASLKEIEVARELAKICANAQQCILGASVMDRIIR